VQIRHATPEDAAFLAKAILIAGRAHVKKGIWEVVLGGTKEECEVFLHHLSITNIPHLFHCSLYLIAELPDIGPIGSLGGYDPGVSGYQALQRAIPEVYKKLNLSERAFKESQERAARILSCLPKDIEGSWVIDSVAVLPAHRRKGVAEMLLGEILARGKRQGYSQAQINMYIGNESALNLYRKFGFEIIEEKRTKHFEENIGSPGMVSLAKNVS
jgi:ribosomal protein S18 acetylase RimI-like enzyme